MITETKEVVIPKLSVVDDNTDTDRSKFESLCEMASTLSGARKLVGEMAAISVTVARNEHEDTRTRVGAAAATAQILSKLPALINAQLDIEYREKAVAAYKLGLKDQDPFAPIDQNRARSLLIELARQEGIEVTG
ncbi:MAG: hypothetical protein ABJX32_18050 [Tateyamaria sp.]|uniref:hypothetical protein n=1 Tax=Tateyamaria sp. TaxID=1929288 RepID=UPI00329C9116